MEEDKILTCIGHFRWGKLYEIVVKSTRVIIFYDEGLVETIFMRDLWILDENSFMIKWSSYQWYLFIFEPRVGEKNRFLCIRVEERLEQSQFPPTNNDSQLLRDHNAHWTFRKFSETDFRWCHRRDGKTIYIAAGSNSYSKSEWCEEITFEGLKTVLSFSKFSSVPEET